jgi:quercetin dioxygenase-like cupin family protein
MEEGDRPELKTLHCSDLTTEIDSLLNDGYRLDMIMPADDPREAIVSKDGESVRLVLSPGFSRQKPPEGGTQNWITGRAGMEYRDLIPERVGGRVIASHIRITDGGEVPDYIHYHKIQFQLIYCKAGSIRVVYEDQGPPFILTAGDCVLQPPQIRHRVLESSAGAEVIEISAPAIHETWVEHEIELPTLDMKTDRDFEGQRFVLHRSDARMSGESCTVTETAIGAATDGYASVRLVKLGSGATYRRESFGEFVFLYVLSGNILENGSKRDLHTDDHVAFTTQTRALAITSYEDSEILEVRLREI